MDQIQTVGLIAASSWYGVSESGKLLYVNSVIRGMRSCYCYCRSRRTLDVVGLIPYSTLIKLLANK